MNAKVQMRRNTSRMGDLSITKGLIPAEFLTNIQLIVGRISGDISVLTIAPSKPKSPAKGDPNHPTETKQITTPGSPASAAKVPVSL
jgi:hypothetical protein